MERPAQAERFEEHRPRLTAVATRALGSPSEAEDAVQEAWLRLDRYDGAPIENLGGWLTRVVGRICIDMLRSRTARAESELDDAADPIVTDDDGPEDVAVESEAVGLALLVVLDSLRPEERLAFVLHDLFAVPFAEIGPIVGRTPDAAKMLASRARRRVQAGPRPAGERREQRAVVDAFLAAAREGDFDALLRLLDPDVTWTVHTARGQSATVGANAVLDVARRGDPSRITARRVSVNGSPGILVWGPTGRPVALMACTVVSGRIVDLVSIVDAARLGRMSLPNRPDGAGR
ncbi:RNA polymerase, sigma-24 subunit, ECF subfamily OS=Tsukamurella paurometabola (strain ATCC 8368 /DSM / CCUG 35730 / CIP 100753 / JCM 10117 / KCTC 9821/ NBRC 16120 / NCIMB 702349 / NCTC 13040) OX=521096 GN=Tpau_3522 PE=3 SV=1 [Tsukamurella paurometabola]|uniref:RNA polymerase, sigma-24 subunit, ECF subfamily n=1 Tax=Tsukamurella paurometabola (strain ATCC 8368 / DSM 20162 / CCUG 35730 / CIP 100753 / JCM 10117 / KCTC 9821 / NBRC 16120 / NCIMB 702349 / NCTC 13040) TaxID=521096 RepID=D5UX82_TSUPD|nr:sigma-70 family RNA polymerase sigma factor [Tsukamurella paurometabola]ADG80101.1 RNA polymerase, sigma-24 subunit, ECF subfamily [Tsukamurella paurometabola DSM 20162]SUP38423.1 RNA polymerase sigma factor SigJ [Tsukamurella paurometabola]